jgi:UPF0716 protein FxsA
MDRSGGNVKKSFGCAADGGRHVRSFPGYSSQGGGSPRRRLTGGNVLGKLALLFIAVPLIELVILVKLGGMLGLLPTIALVVVTGLAGASLARSQGLRVLFQIREEMAAGRMPVDRMLDGLLILIAGVLLLTPGLLTDVAGLAMLVPGPRGVVKRFLGRKVSLMARSGALRVQVYQDSLR